MSDKEIYGAMETQDYPYSALAACQRFNPFDAEYLKQILSSVLFP
jgi:hypothetical protein